MHATVGLLQRCANGTVTARKLLFAGFARDIRFPYRRRNVSREPDPRPIDRLVCEQIRRTSVVHDRFSQNDEATVFQRHTYVASRERIAEITRWKYRLFPFDIPSAPVKLRIVRGSELQFYGLAVFAKLPTIKFTLSILSRRVVKLQNCNRTVVCATWQFEPVKYKIAENVKVQHQMKSVRIKYAFIFNTL